jgi:hypothetical protein
MVAAALTVWALFAVWIAAPYFPLRSPVPRIAMALLATELLALFIYGYGTEGCDERTCAPIAQAAGIAARTDLPALAAAFLLLASLRFARDARRSAAG